MEFIETQFNKIGELFESEQYQTKNEKVESFLYWVGNILFVIACMVLVWKGVFFLYDYFFPPASYAQSDKLVRTHVSRLLKHPQILILLVAGLMFVVRIIVAIKVRIKPFYILSFIGLAMLVKKIWIITFEKDHTTYLNFLKEFGKDLLK